LLFLFFIAYQVGFKRKTKSAKPCVLKRMLVWL